jgi:methylmalonyl-CoA/ethylmalonyl-CoA epimerase
MSKTTDANGLALALGLQGLPLHHVGIVQPSEADVEAMMELLGFVEDFRGYVPHWSALCIFTKPLGRSPVEFVVPDGGPLLRFNNGFGGLHHIALETPDLEDLARTLALQDVEMLEPTPIKGAGDFICNFLSPVTTRGLTVEFVQMIGAGAAI